MTRSIQMPGPLPQSLVLVCATLFGAADLAKATAGEFSPQIWVNPGIYSYHFNRNNDYRENNTGMGAEVLLTDNHALMAASFVNSDRHRSRFVLYQWRPLHWQFSATRVSLGIAAGALDGYPRYRNGGWFAAALPMLSVEGEQFGFNFSVIPSLPNRLHGVAVIQAKLRVW
jgi:hypothetical protein